MTITLTQLIACGIDPTQARIFLDPLNETFDQYEINTRNRQAAFIAQAMQESTKFTRLEENLYYTTADRLYSVFHNRFTSVDDAALYLRNPKKLANHVYANRNGNGPEATGDGWTYRGRGIGQITGKGNYLAVDGAMGTNYTQNPDQLAQPRDACLAFGNYWVRNSCNALADAGNIDAVTRAVNGPAMDGAQNRRQFYAVALRAFA